VARFPGISQNLKKNKIRVHWPRYEIPDGLLKKETPEQRQKIMSSREHNEATLEELTGFLNKKSN